MWRGWTHSLLLLFFTSTLSSCMHAVVALLYPFSWQHTFIPVLPGSMLDIVCCPTPFLVGLLSSSLPKLKELPVEEVCYSSFDHLFFVHSPDSDLGNMDIVVLADEIPDAVQSELMFLSLLGGTGQPTFKKTQLIVHKVALFYRLFYTRTTQRCLR